MSRPPKPTVSIIMSITNRPRNVDYALAAWTKLDYPKFNFTIIDNRSGNPALEDIVNRYKDILNITFYREPILQNINMIWNKYGKMSDGEYVIFSMADEMISDGDIIDKMLKCPKENRTSIFTYFLTERQNNEIDAYDWRTTVRNIPLPFTTETTAGLISHITGNYRKNWEYFGWFREGAGHLWLDQDVHLREVCLGIPAHTPKDVYAIHQWHSADMGYTGGFQPGYTYQNEKQARLLELAIRDSI